MRRMRYKMIYLVGYLTFFMFFILLFPFILNYLGLTNLFPCNCSFSCYDSPMDYGDDRDSNSREIIDSSDYLYWSFSSRNVKVTITVLAMDDDNWENYRYSIGSWTSITLSQNKTADSGYFYPPYEKKWYIVMLNNDSSCETTLLDACICINRIPTNEFYSFSLIMLFVPIYGLSILGILIYYIIKKKKPDHEKKRSFLIQKQTPSSRTTSNQVQVPPPPKTAKIKIKSKVFNAIHAQDQVISSKTESQNYESKPNQESITSEKIKQSIVVNCRFCGEKIPKDSTFCQNCGVKKKKKK